MSSRATGVNILLFQRIVPHYRVPIFRKLFEQLNILVCHSKEKTGATLSSCLDDMDYPNICLDRVYLPGKETFVLQNILYPLLTQKPKIVISEFSVGYLSFWALFILKPFLRYKLIAWTHLSNKEVSTPYHCVKEKISVMAFRCLEAVILYTSDRKERLAQQLEDSSKLFVAHNTLDLSELLALHEKFVRTGRDHIKEELGFKEEHHLIFIGRLISRKRLDLTLAAFEKLQPTFDVALHIIGSGPELDVVKEYVDRVPSVYYHGAIFDNELAGKYLYASDILINPGHVGLSIVHAFSFETPIITCKTTDTGPHHSPEITYLRDGENGLLCDSDADSIVHATETLLNDGGLLRRMSVQAFETATNDCSVQRMVEGFEKAIEYVSSK